MSVVDFLVPAGFGGLAGSLLTFIVTSLQGRKKDIETRDRVKALVRNELKTVRDLIQRRMLDPATSSMPMITFVDTSIEVLRADRIIESLQYPTMSVEIKVKNFAPAMLIELQEIYIQIFALKTRRGYTSEHVFEHTRSVLINLVEDIDEVMQKIDHS